MKPMRSNVYPVGGITTERGTTPKEEMLSYTHNVSIMQDK